MGAWRTWASEWTELITLLTLLSATSYCTLLLKSNMIHFIISRPPAAIIEQGLHKISAFQTDGFYRLIPFSLFFGRQEALGAFTPSSLLDHRPKKQLEAHHRLPYLLG